MKFFIFPVWVLIGVLLPSLKAAAYPMTLVFDDFKSPTDSLWHFETAAFRNGLFSPGKNADIPGGGKDNGQLKIDAQDGRLIYKPRQLSQDFRSCFLAYRDDFLMPGSFAAQVRISLALSLINPSANDTVGGLFALVRYMGQDGQYRLIRSASPIGAGAEYNLQALKWYPVKMREWLTPEDIEPRVLNWALSHVAGIGLMYISGTTLLAGSTALKIDGFKAVGEIAMPRLAGFPGDTEIWAGDTLEMGWRFPASLRAQWTWYRNDKVVADAKGATYRYATTLQDVRTHLFRAEAKLDNGEVIASETQRIVVKGKIKPAVYKQIHDTLAPIGGEVVFGIKAKGVPPLKYQWYHKDKALPGATTDTLVLVPSHMRQGGVYYCEVTDRWGMKARSHSANLVVKPRMEQQEPWYESLAFTVKAGANVADFYQAEPNQVDPDDNPDSHNAWNYLQGGAQVVWDFAPRLGLQGDLLFSRKGVRWKYKDHTDELKLDYAELPVFLRIGLTKKNAQLPVHFLVGGYGAVLMVGQHQEDWGDWKGNLSAGEFTWYDFGPSLGLVFQYGGISLEGRASVGAANLNDYAPERPIRLWTASILLGFTLKTPYEQAQ